MDRMAKCLRGVSAASLFALNRQIAASLFALNLQLAGVEVTGTAKAEASYNSDDTRSIIRALNGIALSIDAASLRP